MLVEVDEEEVMVKMTDLQIKYQSLKEAERANRASEAIKSMETESASSLRRAQESEVAAQIDKILADTSLSQANKRRVISDTVGNYINTFLNVRNNSELSRTRNFIADIFLKMLPGGKR